MNSDLVLPLVASVAWLVLAVSALASQRLGWRQVVKIALAWVAIFSGIFMIVDWVLYAQGSGTSLL